MCGIAGLIRAQAPLQDTAALASRMAAQLRHRGPDGAAYFADQHALLVHTRLSIIDLETGQQPIYNEDKSVWVAFNGEIFNYLELRADLLRRGHRFYTQSDTEVIVHLYEDHGLDFVHHLNGQFAIALWDSRRRRAILVRDRVGIAPLFYCNDADGLWFGSEVKAILAGRQKIARLSAPAISDLLSFWAPVSPSTVFEGVYQVSPGHMLVFADGEMQCRCYWDCQFPAVGEAVKPDEEEAAGRVRELLTEAVRIRLRADVPVGAYLSGGLDSSIIASTIAADSRTPLRTFSLNFDDPQLDETPFQQAVVEQLDVDHTACHVQHDAVLDTLLPGIWHAETPIIRTAPLPMARLSSQARQAGFKVVLTGEGADEIFGGYDLFKETKLRRFWAQRPDSAWRPLLLQRLYPYLRLSRGTAAAYLESFFGTGVSDPDYGLFSHQPRMNSTNGVRTFLGDYFFDDGFASAPEAESAERLLSTLPADFQRWPAVSRAQYLEIKTLMAGYLLSSQGDRMLMQHSVEGRFPFLDHRVIEYVNQLAPCLKIKVLREKYILKRAFRERLPASVVNRYKLPYRAPMGAAFARVAGNDVVKELLSEANLRRTAYFDERKIGFLLKKAETGRTSYKDDMALIFILSCQAWHHLFVDQFAARFQSTREPAIARVQ